MQFIIAGLGLVGIGYLGVDLVRNRWHRYRWQKGAALLILVGLIGWLVMRPTAPTYGDISITATQSRQLTRLTDTERRLTRNLRNHRERVRKIQMLADQLRQPATSLSGDRRGVANDVAAIQKLAAQRQFQKDVLVATDVTGLMQLNRRIAWHLGTNRHQAQQILNQLQKDAGLPKLNLGNPLSQSRP
ncbi:hypothetical protein [Lactiplantibacillus carotarum]|uniref:hypothetical protein n=1 Tax=Lactiplantibacillus carotarum TaxID=2993456 RepID=UPI00298F37DB|nr:hypothetical protein [Lactiplantibacillus carotarum]